MNYKPSHAVILIPQSREKNLGLLLDASSERGMDRDVSLSLNMTVRFARSGFSRLFRAVTK
jgi:hypothetical protein